MTELADRDCVPCRGGEPALDTSAIATLKAALSGDWDVVDGHHLVRRFRFPDFAAALAFTNRVGEIAEEQGHHPDILLAWGRVDVTIWTHAINGLSESDFILAAKVDRLAARG